MLELELRKKRKTLSPLHHFLKFILYRSEYALKPGISKENFINQKLKREMECLHQVAIIQANL